MAGNVDGESMLYNYILIVKTLHGDPTDRATIIIKGNDGQTEKMYLGKSQSHSKAFKENQTDVFVLTSHVNVGHICQVQFDVAMGHRSKEWKYNQIAIIYGTRIYQGGSFEYSLLSLIHSPSVTNVMEPIQQLQESVYYALVKTGNDGCSKDCFPRLSLFGPQQQQPTTIQLKPIDAIRPAASLNNLHALEKGQLDLFQWRDANIGHIERMHLVVTSKHKPSKCQWNIEWVLVIHHGYTFSGRIILNRTVKPDRMVAINLEQKIPKILTPSTSNEQGDLIMLEKKPTAALISMDLLNKQFNASSADIGRYYVIIRNVDGTTGDVYIDFHGDRLASSGEQHLSRCENYPDHPFTSKHADLFHVKALEVGHIEGVTIRLDQTVKEHSLTLESLFIIHNAIMYHFDLHDVVLNKGQAKKKFHPLPAASMPLGKSCYYIATHTSDKVLAGTNATLKVIVNGTRGMFGPLELKESLTNGSNPFERECIDVFRVEEADIGDPVSISITLESKGLLPHLFSGAQLDRIMVVKDGDYNSLWQAVGDLKVKEAKLIPLPVRGRSSIKDAHPPPLPPPVSIAADEPIRSDVSGQMAAVPMVGSPQTVKVEKSTPWIETQPSPKVEPLIIEKPTPGGDARSRSSHLTIADIEEHQKRHTFAPTLSEAERNYRDLRRLLRKMNGPSTQGRKPAMTNHNSITSINTNTQK